MIERGRVLQAAAAFGILVSTACSESASESVAQWTVSKELRIGSESQPEYALTEVRGIVVAEDGSIFVLQPADGLVRVFDGDGRFLTYIGRPGEGPGEFTGIVGFGLHGDTVWVSDQRGIQRFESTGRYLGSEVVRYDPPGGNLSPNGPDQIFIDGTLSVMPGFIPNLDRSTWPTQLPLHRVQGDLFRGELAAFDLDVIQLYAAPDGRPRFAFRPFHPLAVYGYAPDRMSLTTVRQAAAASSSDATFRVSRIGFNGDTIFSRNVSYVPLPVSTTIRDSIEASVPAPIAAARFDVAPIPQHYPPVQALTIASDQSTWVDLQGHMAPRWLVLDGTGKHVATATGDGLMRIFVVRGDHVWAVVKDELDVSYVVRARIVREAM